VKRILILFAHPALEKSRVNLHLCRAVRHLDDVTFHDLYEIYPEFDVDVAREQKLLVEHDIVVLQHPFYWYSTPALIKEWEDLVLEHGWAYGDGGTALEGKQLICAISAGGNEAAYCAEGQNRFTVRQLLAPIEQTSRLCGMEFLPPFVIHGTHALTERAILGCAEEYRQLIEALRDERLDLARVRGLARINEDLAGLFAGRGK